MPLLNNTYKLVYFRPMSLPIAGIILYQIEIYLIKHRILKTIFISGKKNKFQKFLIQFLKSKKSVICSQHNISWLLRQINNNIILDLKIKNISQARMVVHKQIIDSLTVSKYITNQTVDSLKLVFPEIDQLFPVINLKYPTF